MTPNDLYLLETARLRLAIERATKAFKRLVVAICEKGEK
jgi:hypothetical protein